MARKLLKPLFFLYFSSLLIPAAAATPGGSSDSHVQAGLPDAAGRITDIVTGVVDGAVHGTADGKKEKQLPPHLDQALADQTVPPKVAQWFSPEKIRSLVGDADRHFRDADKRRAQGEVVTREDIVRGTVGSIISSLEGVSPEELQPAVKEMMRYLIDVRRKANELQQQSQSRQNTGREPGTESSGSGYAGVHVPDDGGGSQDLPPQAITAPEVMWGGYSGYFPMDQEGYLKQSEFKRRRGDNKGAFVDLSRGIQNTGGTPDLFYQRGHIAAKAGDHEQAAQDAAMALRMDPSHQQALALYKLSQNKVSNVRIDPDRPDFGTQNLLASAQLPDAGRSAGGAKGSSAGRGAGSGRAAGALAPPASRSSGEARYGQTLEQRSAGLVKEAITAMRVKDYRSALKKAEQAIEANPKSAAAYNVQAAIHIQRKDFRAAARAATQGLDLAPENVPLLNTRALTWNKSGEYRSGLRDAATAVGIAPRSGGAYFNLAFARTGLGRKAEALEDLKQAAALDPRFRKAYETALQLPDDEDSLFLFDDALGAGAPHGAAPVKSMPWWPFLLIGVVLLGFGAFHVLKPSFAATVPAESGYGDGSVYSDDPDTMPPDGFWNRYMVTREIAAGGMGIVYEAMDRGLDRKVAIKKMRDEIREDRRERARFLGEAKTVAKMKHPSIVEIYAIEEDGDDAYLVFEYVAGRTLYELINDKGRLTVTEALPIFKGVCEALEYAHKRDIIHRDLKTANIMVDDDGRPKVMDFGIAKLGHDAEGRAAKTATIIGTPLYMAPEQEEGHVRRESDIYALGICLYEALGAAMPFQGTPGAVLLSKREARYQRLSQVVADVPEAVSAVIDRALHPDPDKRIRTPMRFYQELAAAAKR